MFKTDMSFLYRVQVQGPIADSAGPPPSINTDTDHLQVKSKLNCNQCPKMTDIFPGWIRQPRKPPLQTFSNASKFKKSEDIGIWTQFCPAC